MRIRIPSKKVCERFFLIYELEGCKEAVNYLAPYYGIKSMRIVLDGRRTGNGNRACYIENKAYFTKRGLGKRTVLHEFYHHLVDAKRLDLPSMTEEKEANGYARDFLKNG
jgi:hypothetical protein